MSKQFANFGILSRRLNPKANRTEYTGTLTPKCGACGVAEQRALRGWDTRDVINLHLEDGSSVATGAAFQKSKPKASPPLLPDKVARQALVKNAAYKEGGFDVLAANSGCTEEQVRKAAAGEWSLTTKLILYLFNNYLTT